MIYLLIAAYLIITLALYKWLQPSQFASAFSNVYLLKISSLWPMWIILIVVFDVWASIKYSRDVKLEKFNEIKPADPGPRSQKS